MTQADAKCSERKTISQQFREWAIEKGVDYLKRGNVKEHMRCFKDDIGLEIRFCVAHDLVARLVRQSNSKATAQKKAGVTFFCLRPSLLKRFY